MHVMPKSHKDERFSVAARAAANAAAAKAREDGRELPSDQWAERRELDISHGVPVELKAGECMFHHCLNFHGTPANVTEGQRRAFVMIFMAQDVCFNEVAIAEPRPRSNDRSCGWRTTRRQTDSP